MINTFFSIRIKEIRENNGLKQKDLAHILNLSKSIICSYEKGTRMATLYTLIRISEIFNIDINYLIGREISIVNKNRFVGNFSYEEYELIKELRKYSKLHSILINNPKRTLFHINKKIF